MTDLTFASLLSSRICHDLISPVGAINNGLEILGDGVDDDMREQAMALIRQSASSASAKLQFMRLAFGAAGGVSEVVSLEEAKALTNALVEPTPISLDWQAGAVTLDKKIVKLLLNIIFIGFESLPRGGVLRVGVRREGATNLMISAEGPKVRVAAQTVEILENGADMNEIEPRLSNVLLTHSLAHELGASFFASVSDDRAEIAATF